MWERYGLSFIIMISNQSEEAFSILKKQATTLVSQSLNIWRLASMNLGSICYKESMIEAHATISEKFDKFVTG